MHERIKRRKAQEPEGREVFKLVGTLLVGLRGNRGDYFTIWD